MSTYSSSDAQTDGPSPGVRAMISLGLFIHFFFISICLSSNLVRSELQARLLNSFAIYTQLMNFDLNFTPYQLTHATEEDVDHRIEILPADVDAADDSNWMRLNQVTNRASERYKRYQRLARVMSYLSEDDAIAGELAKRFGIYTLEQLDQKPARVRCRKHMLQGWEFVDASDPLQRDPESETYYRTVYAARIVGDKSSVAVVKIDDVGQVAQPGTEQEENGQSN